MDSKGRIYFTDPRYGSREGMEIIEPGAGCIRGYLSGDVPVEGVYRINDPSIAAQQTFRSNAPNTSGLREKKTADQIAYNNASIDALLDGTLSSRDLHRKKMPIILSARKIDALLAQHVESVTRIRCGSAERPNGILISPDDRYLYIADNNNNNHGGSRKLLRYTLDKNGDVKPGTRKVLFDWKDGRGPDGMKMDAAGRIYVAAGTNKVTEFETTRFKAGCYILSPSGRLIDFIPASPDECCNCAFGGTDGKTLFITSGGHLWSVPLK
jgi:sugar lactone lactonase YvrE